MSLPKHATSEPTIGELVKDVTANLSTVIHGEIELAKMELKSSLRFGGVGVLMFVLAGVVVLFSLTFGFIALAEGLIAAGLWRWAAYLAVFGLLIVFALGLVAIGYRLVKKIRPPQLTIDTTKETVTALKTAASNSEPRQ